MDENVPPPLPQLPYAQAHASPGSGSLIAAAVLCFLGTLVPLGWLAVQVSNVQVHQLHAALTATRLPFGLLLLEDVVCALGLAGLLLVSGVLLCLRARWAIHVAGALMGVVLVGATGATVAEAVRRLSKDPPLAKPMSEHVAEIALRAGTSVLLPFAVIVLLSRRSVRSAIVFRRGSLPATPVLIFTAGTVLIWYGLAATSLHEQANAYEVYFGRFYGGVTVTLWRVGFAAAWVLAGVLLVSGGTTGCLLGLVVTLAHLASELILAAMGGADALARESFSRSSDQLGAILAMSAGPDAPWPAALWRSATALCLLGLVLLAAEDLLFEDVPDPQEAAGDAGA
jgi:hypothetical protein